MIISGEDLTEYIPITRLPVAWLIPFRFRNASKELYTFLRSFSWNDKVERLGFDEVSPSIRILKLKHSLNPELFQQLIVSIS